MTAELVFDNVLGDGWIRTSAASPATSRKAGHRASLTAGTQAHRVLQAISDTCRGLTDDEIGERLGLTGNSVRPRRGSLKDRGFITAAGVRKNRQGNECVVWVLTPAGAQALRWAK